MTLDTIIILVIILCVYMWPLAIIAASDRSRGNEKTYWILATIFLSWIGLILYRFTTFSEKERRKRHRQKLEVEHKKARALKKKRLKAQQAAAANPTESEPEFIEQDEQQNKEPPHVDGSA